ncbi:MAG TPA: TetR/AcrR family transcriptional regulator [Roseiarcus sp.]|nr:TetR/AcrR family transcriptional regulator [Roseiarcus sp.]
MNVAARPTADETRERILVAAEELFRRIGYWKTTVGDIAEALDMSSANIYRFFPSKMAINEGLCAKLLGALLEAAQNAAASHGTAGERVFNLLMTLHRHHREHMTNQERVHEMVLVAMEEDWASIEAFINKCKGLTAKLIAEGQASGEFGPGDPAVLGELTFSACAAILHPMLIAKCAKEGRTGEEIDAIAQGVVAFALRALASHQPLPALKSCQSPS